MLNTNLPTFEVRDLTFIKIYRNTFSVNYNWHFVTTK